MKRTIIINVADDIPNADKLLPENVMQAIQRVLEYGERQGKTSIQCEDIDFHIRRNIMHYLRYYSGDISEPNLEHAATRAVIILKKYYDEHNIKVV